MPKSRWKTAEEMDRDGFTIDSELDDEVYSLPDLEDEEPKEAPVTEPTSE